MAMRIAMTAVTKSSSRTVRPARSECVAIDEPSVGPMAQAAVDMSLDGVHQEPHRAVAEEEIGPSRVRASEPADVRAHPGLFLRGGRLRGLRVRRVEGMDRI